MKDQFVVVTGASSGIGAEAAVALARPGRRLALVARRDELLSRVADRVRAIGAAASTHAVDLRDMDATSTLGADLLALGVPDVLVLNAGRSSSLSVDTLPERFDAVTSCMGVNFLGGAKLTSALLPAWREAGGAHVVGVTSVNARIPAPGWGAYSASKAAFDSWLRAVSPELRVLGVSTTIVAFPLVRTPMIEPVYGRPRWAMSPQRAARWIVRAVERRPAEIGPWWLRPAEVATALAPHATARLVARASLR